ncbi:MAG: hypothetical protein AABY22_20295 [Nanoarchaeota archaeon]
METKEELLAKKAELEKKLTELEIGSTPKPVAIKNWEPLIELCEDYIRQLEEEKYVDEDTEHYIFEVAMEAVFGKEVWKWINNIEQ